MRAPAGEMGSTRPARLATETLRRFRMTDETLTTLVPRYFAEVDAFNNRALSDASTDASR
jgi:hypothetical protein